MKMMVGLKIWWRWQVLACEARRWLQANDPEEIAAYCLYHLNHAAADRDHDSSSIYALKGSFIRYLYENWRCVRLSQQRQDMPCWECGPDHPDPECWKCEGTGVYRSHRLFQFTFRVGPNNRTYVWHQPANLAPWLYWDPTSDPGQYKAPSRQERRAHKLDPRLAELYYVTLYLFLRSKGIKPGLNAAPSLRQIVRQWIKGSRWWYHKIYLPSYRIGRLWEAVKQYLKTGDWYIEPEIPF